MWPERSPLRRAIFFVPGSSKTRVPTSRLDARLVFRCSARFTRASLYVDHSGMLVYTYLFMYIQELSSTLAHWRSSAQLQGARYGRLPSRKELWGKGSENARERACARASTLGATLGGKPSGGRTKEREREGASSGQRINEMRGCLKQASKVFFSSWYIFRYIYFFVHRPDRWFSLFLLIYLPESRHRRNVKIQR